MARMFTRSPYRQRAARLQRQARIQSPAPATIKPSPKDTPSVMRNGAVAWGDAFLIMTVQRVEAEPPGLNFIGDSPACSLETARDGLG